MKVLILAGGFGTRLSEETNLIPKPMVPLGDKPILWHIMSIYSHYGFNDFVILAGYKAAIIKEYFLNFYPLNSDITVDLSNNTTQIINSNTIKPWKVTIIDSGLNAMTGGRLLSARHLIDDDFMLTYGDGVSNVNIPELVKFHQQQKTIATLTAVKPYGRFGALEITNNKVQTFAEKKDNNHYINGGFFVFSPAIFDYLKDESTILEQEPLATLATQNQLSAYQHNGFWYAMDTLKDKTDLSKMYTANQAPWKLWQ
jgi:glucose-1-phosphate cytidylyltransferase